MLVAIEQGSVTLMGEIRPPLNLKRTMHVIEDHIIAKVLQECNGHRGQAAKILGLGRTTLIEKMHSAALRRRALEHGWKKVIEA